MKFYQLNTIIQLNNNALANFFDLEHIAFFIDNNVKSNHCTNIRE